MRKLTKYILFIALAPVAVSCATTAKTISIAVSDVSDKVALQQSSFIYSMPQTVIDVYVTAEEVSIIPGPFEKYAEKYLGIENAPSKAEKVYNLKKVSISQHVEADPDFVYSASGVYDPATNPGLYNLIKDSLILKASDFAGNKAATFTWPGKSTDMLYTDLSIKRNFEAEKDVEISLVLPDTDYVAPASSRKALKEKTPEQKAEEAANFLIKLKKRRFKLVAGQYDYMPEGESMSAALNELARIEEEYLALFIGRRIVSEISATYHYTPVAEKTNDRTVLFRFSNSKGFLSAGDSDGMPIIITLMANNKIKELGLGKIPLKLPQNTVPYRVPDQATVKLLAGEQIWADAIYPVFQYGIPVTMYLGK